MADTHTLLIAAAVNVFLIILLLIAAKVLKRHADKVIFLNKLH